MSNFFTFPNPPPNFSHKGTKTQRNTKGFYFFDDERRKEKIFHHRGAEDAGAFSAFSVFK
jgi:hypothetical protein